MTVAEYLAHERAAVFKSEFFGGRLYPLHNPFGPADPSAMAGASREHNRVTENLVVHLGSRFLNGPCVTFSSDQRVRVSPTGRYAYPDVVIVCDPPEFAADDRDALTNPQVIIEVLSQTTERYDRGLKFAEYQRQPSIREVLFVAQDYPRVERYVSQSIVQQLALDRVRRHGGGSSSSTPSPSRCRWPACTAGSTSASTFRPRPTNPARNDRPGRIPTSADDDLLVRVVTIS